MHIVESRPWVFFHPRGPAQRALLFYKRIHLDPPSSGWSRCIVHWVSIGEAKAGIDTGGESLLAYGKERERER